MKILHVITDVDSDLAYGGPLTNALSIAAELSENNQVSILGIYRRKPMEFEHGVSSFFSRGRSLSKRHPFVLQSSLRFVPATIKAVKNADVVHVHFGREFVSVFSSFICILKNKRLVIQPHGMLNTSNRLSIRVWDFFCTRPILKRASACIALQEREKDYLDLKYSIQSVIIRNGISKRYLSPYLERQMISSNECQQIVFLARMHKRKNPKLFLEAARMIKQQVPNTKIAMFGSLSNNKDSDMVKFLKEEAASGTYFGSLNHQEALETLASASLLILPSLNEPFPISIIESLCLGTPVVVMEDCGLVSILREMDPDFISSFSVEEIAERGSKLLLRYKDFDNRMELSKRALAKFGMQEILSSLLKTYKL